MVAPRVQKRLIDSAHDEMLLDQVLEPLLPRAEHVVEAVAVVLEPEVVVSLRVEGGVGALADLGVHDGVGVRTVYDALGVGDERPGAGPQGASEPIVPIPEAPMRLAAVKRSRRSWPSSGLLGRTSRRALP